MWKSVLPAILTTLLLGGCLDPCRNTEVKSALSPDGLQRAVLYERSCGATTGFSTQVSILGRGEKAKEAGNVFTADDDHGKAEAGAWGGVWADILWLSRDRLLITHAAQARIWRAERQLGKVSIRYAVGRRSP